MTVQLDEELVERALAAHERECPRDRAGEARPERRESDDGDLDPQALYLEREEVRHRGEHEAGDDGDGRHRDVDSMLSQ